MVNVESLPKLQRICGAGSWIVLVIAVFAALLLIGCCVYTALAMNDPSYVVEPMDNMGTVINGFCEIIMLATCLWCLILGHGLLRSIADNESPFIHQNVAKIREIALALLVSFLIIILLQILLALALQPELYLFDIPLQMLVSGVVCYVFYLIFEYGTALQTESDDFL